ncbi:MAG: TIR domain-containing protein [Gammaproteobacteria bacterium]|nr:MAG: TIR domain-containing protein [Gammaproteobacteria bacterium]
MTHPPIQSYQGDEPFVFVSYSHADEALVYPLLQALAASGINVWFDEGVTPGERWTASLASAIEECAAFLMLISRQSVASDHCVNEVQFALNRSKPFLAVHLEKTTLPPHLELSIGHRQAILAHRVPPGALADRVAAALSDLASGSSQPTARAQAAQRGATRSPSLVKVLGAVSALAALVWLVGQALTDFRTPEPPPAPASTDSQPQVHPEALAAYEEGMRVLGLPTSRETIEQAEILFREALAQDQEPALARAGLCTVSIDRHGLDLDPVDLVTAQRHCHQARVLNAELWQVQLALGRLYRRTGEYDQSLEALETAIRLDPNQSEIHRQRGWTLDTLGETVAAEAAFLKAIELAPGDWQGYRALASYYYDHAEYDKAMRVFEQLPEMLSDDTNLLQSIGAVQLATGNLDAALKSFGEVERRQSPAPERRTLTNIGITYYHLGCFEEAAYYQKAAAQRSDSDHRVLGRLAESCRFVPGERPQAEALWAHAVELARHDPDERSWSNQGLLAIYHAHLGEQAASREALEAMWALHPEPSIAHFFAAIVQKLQGDPAAAETSISESLKAGYSPALMALDPDLNPVPACPLAERITHQADTCAKP